MINWLIVALMVAMAALYNSAKPEFDESVAALMRRDMAGDMDIYRRAVLAYYESPSADRSVPKIPPTSLISTIPRWSHMRRDGGLDWGNYRKDSIVYIYYARQKPLQIASELDLVSHRSALVGIRAENALAINLLNPVAGKATYPLPPELSTVPSDTPVWIAQTN